MIIGALLTAILLQFATPAAANPAPAAVDLRCGTTIVLTGDLGPLWRPWAQCPADKPVRYDAWAATVQRVYVAGARGLVVEGLTVDSAQQIGVQIAGSADVSFVGTTVRHVAFGFFVANSQRISLTFGRLTDLGSDCFNLNAVDYVTIADNLCRIPLVAAGIHPDAVQVTQRPGIDPPSSHVTAERNVFIGAMQGFYSVGATDSVVRDNVFRLGFKNAVLIIGAPASSVTRNIVEADRGAAVVPTIAATGSQVCGNRGTAVWGAQGLSAC